MPTGYTAGVTEQTTFEQFAWTCARAFGALITMRDDPNDVPIPEKLEPSPFYRDSLEAAERKLAEMETWTLDRFAADQAESIDSDRKSNEHYRAEATSKRNAYDRMLALVEKWTPPSADHEEMRRFMIKQLTESREFDCTPYMRVRYEVTPEEWRSQCLESQRKTVERYREEWRKEVERTDSRNLWIQQLRDSLKTTMYV